MGVLGSILLMPEVCDDIASLRADDFYDDANRVLYDVLRNMHDDGEKIDITLLVSKLRTAGNYEKVGGAAYLASLSTAVPNAAHAVYYADIVAEKAVYRKLITSSTEILRDAYDQTHTAKELMAQAEQKMFAIMDGKSGQTVQNINDILHQAMDRMEARLRDDYVDGACGTGFSNYDDMTGGMHAGELIILAARPSMGKAQPLDAKVLTASGFKPMADIRVGDELASVDGRPSRVTGVFPQGIRQVYQMTLSDGRRCEACAEHLWTVHYRGWPEPRTLETQQLVELLGRARYRNRLWIETFDGSFGSDADLPLDPWLLGLLIAEGDFGGRSPRVSTSEASTLAAVGDQVGAVGCEPAPAGGYDHHIERIGGAHAAGIQGVLPNPITRVLRDFGLAGLKAHEKFVPPGYLNASKEDRIRLLSGLLDGDGWVGTFGSVRYGTSSRQLADDVVRLVRSLGGTATVRPKSTTYTDRGERRSGRPSYVCNLRHEDAAEWFTLKSKRERLAGGRRRRKRLNIRSIEPTRKTNTQCIAVSHPSHLYVTDDFIVTHNTALAMNIGEHISINDKRPVLFISLEMSGIELADRMLCSLARVNGHRLRNGTIGSDDQNRLVAKANEISNSPLYVDDSPARTVSEIAAAARRIKRREGSLGMIIIDYLQLIEPDNSKDPRQEQVAKMARRLKGVARELNVPMLCLSQLNRQAEDSKDHRPRLSHLRESGAIEQDADVVMFVHREEYYHRGDDRAQFAGQAEIIIAKQRNGPIGEVLLTWESDYTRFSDRAPSHHSEFDDYAEYSDPGGF